MLPSRENEDPSPDPALLRRDQRRSPAAERWTSAGLEGLLGEFPGGEERREPISSRLDDVWDRWGTLLALLAVLSAEWVLRKRLELV